MLAIADGFGLVDILIDDIVGSVRVLLFDGGRRDRRLRGDRLGGLDAVHLFALFDQERLRGADRRVGVDRDGDLEAALQLAQMRALVIERIERDFRARAHDQVMRRALQQHLFEHAEEMQRD